MEINEYQKLTMTTLNPELEKKELAQSQFFSCSVNTYRGGGSFTRGC